jgi:hypothetical protein
MVFEINKMAQIAVIEAQGCFFAGSVIRVHIGRLVDDYDLRSKPMQHENSWQ